MKGTEQIRLILTIVIGIAKSIKASEKLPAIILAQVGKIIKIRFKELALEVKDLTVDEIQAEIDFIVSEGFKESVAKKVLGNLTGAKMSTIPNLVKDLLKKF
jgi:hypothetical protein